MKIDAKFIVDEMKNVITSRMIGVAQSFIKTGDKGAVMIKVNMEQISDSGEIHVDIEVNSKQAPRASVSYACKIDGATGELESLQLGMGDIIKAVK